MTGHELIEKFIESRLIRGLSDRTIENYVSRLKLFGDFCGDLDVMELTEQHILTYMALVMHKGKCNVMIPGKCDHKIARDTQYTYLNILRIFLNWAGKEGYVLPMSGIISLPKRQKKLVDIYTPAEMQMIFDALRNNTRWIELRNRALVSLLYDSGLRLSEALSLTPAMIRTGCNSLKVTGKGNKDRFVPLGKFTRNCLDDYMNALPFDLGPGDQIYRSNRGRPLTVDNVECIFYRLRKRTGFAISPHKLRHNFATNFLADQYREKGSADIYQLMLILGHSDVKTCRIYLHMAQALVVGEGSHSHLDKIFGMSDN